MRLSENRRKEIQELCLENLTKLKIEDQNFQNGLDFHKYMFANFSELRVYFKGAQKYEAEDIQKSERFKKLGQRVLLSVNMAVYTFLNKMVFNAFVRDQVARHVHFKIDPKKWDDFWVLWSGFLATKMDLTDQHKKAWIELGEEFSNVAHE